MGPLFPYRNDDVTQQEAHDMWWFGDEDIRFRNRAPDHSPHSTHAGRQVPQADRPDRPGESQGGKRPKGSVRFGS